MCKIFLFGVGGRDFSQHSSVACNSRPGLLQVRISLSSVTWAVNAPQGAPNRNILHIGTKKTTTCPFKGPERVKGFQKSELVYAVVYLFGNEERVEKTPFERGLD